MIIRNDIISNLSLFDAGIYEFVIRVSGAVIIFFSLTISTYYLPRISEISLKKDLLKEIKHTYLIVLPIVSLLLIFIYLLRNEIILILANSNFESASPLFFWILFGVFFKICTQVIGFVFLSKAKIKSVIFVEIIYNVFMSISTVFFVQYHGLIGAAVAFFICNLLYFIGVLILFYNVFLTKKVFHVKL